MTNALELAYAGNGSLPLVTLEFLHPALDGGALRLVQAAYDVGARLETGQTVTFTASGIITRLPEKSTDGQQDLDIQVDNTNNEVWRQIQLVVKADRTSPEKVICNYRPYLEADLTAPAGAVMPLTVKASTVNMAMASIRASYAPIPDISFPRYRYYPHIYPGIKYI